MVNTLQLVWTHIGARHWLHIPAIDQRFPLLGSDLIVRKLRFDDRIRLRSRLRHIPLRLSMLPKQERSDSSDNSEESDGTNDDASNRTAAERRSAVVSGVSAICPLPVSLLVPADAGGLGVLVIVPVPNAPACCSRILQSIATAAPVAELCRIPLTFEHAKASLFSDS